MKVSILLLLLNSAELIIAQKFNIGCPKDQTFHANLTVNYELVKFRVIRNSVGEGSAIYRFRLACQGKLYTPLDNINLPEKKPMIQAVYLFMASEYAYRLSGGQLESSEWIKKPEGTCFKREITELDILRGNLTRRLRFNGEKCSTEVRISQSEYKDLYPNITGFLPGHYYDSLDNNNRGNNKKNEGQSIYFYISIGVSSLLLVIGLLAIISGIILICKR